jgi:hypothetical protein
VEVAVTDAEIEGQLIDPGQCGAHEVGFIVRRGVPHGVPDPLGPVRQHRAVAVVHVGVHPAEGLGERCAA